MSEDSKHNDLQKIITQSIEEMKQEQGEKFSLQAVNLAELERRTGSHVQNCVHSKRTVRGKLILQPLGKEFFLSR